MSTITLNILVIGHLHPKPWSLYMKRVFGLKTECQTYPKFFFITG